MTCDAVGSKKYGQLVLEQLERDAFLKSIGRNTPSIFRGHSLTYIEEYRFESEMLWQKELRRRADEKLQCHVCHIKVSDPRHWRGDDPVHVECLSKLRVDTDRNEV